MLWLEGELVHVEELVLHDAQMDISTPSHELTRAHGVLRARRQILANKPDWALISPTGLRHLTRRGPHSQSMDEGAGQDRTKTKQTIDAQFADAQAAAPQSRTLTAQDDLTKALEAMDAALQRSATLLDGQQVLARDEDTRRSERPSLVYDLDWDENARLEEWQSVMAQTRAAILIEAWSEVSVLQRAGWLGHLLVAALLRQEGIAAHHLPSLALGFKHIPRERRCAMDPTTRLVAVLDVLHETPKIGPKEHDRLVLVKAQTERRLGARRTNSRLPDLIELVLSRPLVSSGMMQEALKVSK